MRRGEPLLVAVDEGPVGALVHQDVGIVSVVDLAVDRRYVVVRVRQTPVGGRRAADYRAKAIEPKPGRLVVLQPIHVGDGQNEGHVSGPLRPSVSIPPVSSKARLISARRPGSDGARWEPR